MDDISEVLQKVSTHCGNEEYRRLLGSISMCKYYTNLIDTAKRTNKEMDRYLSEINLEPAYYLGVSLRNFQYIVELCKFRESYLNLIRNNPREYDLHIATAMRFFELLQEGAELGYVVYSTTK